MKAFWKSKTLWLNILSLGLYSLKSSGVEVPAPDPAALAIANLILRVVTKQGVSVKDSN